MADKVGEIYVELEARSDKMEKELKSAERQTSQSSDKMSNSLKKIAITVGSVVAAFMALRKVRGILDDLTQAARRQERALRMLEGQVKATGGAAGFTALQLQRMAGELQAVSNFGDEELMETAISSMLKFNNVTGATFERSIALVADMTTQTGSLSGNAERLGRSLEDPIRAITMLERSGIQFNAEQEKMIRGFMETNELAKAQAIVLDAVEGRYGGLAKAMVEPTIQLKNLWGDLQEELGFGMVRASDNIARSLIPVLENAIDYMVALRHDTKGFREELDKLNADGIKGAKEALEDKTEAIKGAHGWLLELRAAWLGIKTAGVFVGKTIESTIRDTTATLFDLLNTFNLIPGINYDLQKSYEDLLRSALGDTAKLNELYKDKVAAAIEYNNKMKQEQSEQETLNELTATRIALQQYLKQEMRKQIDEQIAGTRLVHAEEQELLDQILDSHNTITKINDDIHNRKLNNLRETIAKEAEYAKYGLENIEIIKEAWDTYFEHLLTMYNEDSREYKAALKQKDEYMEMFKDEASAVWQEIGNIIASNMASAFGNIISWTDETSSAFEKMTESILVDIARMIARKAVLTSLSFIPVFGGITGGFFNEGGTVGYNQGGTAGKEGKVIYASSGMSIPGYGTRDTVPAMLTPGEEVINALSAQLNRPLLKAINNNPYAVQHMASGGTAGFGNIEGILNRIAGKDNNVNVNVINRIDPNMVSDANKIGIRKQGNIAGL